MLFRSYYEEVLKFKYNESKGARKMIDIAHDTIDTPFESVINPYICSEAGTAQIYNLFLTDAKNGSTSFKSSYDGMRDTLQTTLNNALEKFAKLQ